MAKKTVIRRTGKCVPPVTKTRPLLQAEQRDGLDLIIRTLRRLPRQWMANDYLEASNYVTDEEEETERVERRSDYTFCAIGAGYFAANPGRKDLDTYEAQSWGTEVFGTKLETAIVGLNDEQESVGDAIAALTRLREDQLTPEETAEYFPHFRRKD